MFFLGGHHPSVPLTIQLYVFLKDNRDKKKKSLKKRSMDVMRGRRKGSVCVCV